MRAIPSLTFEDVRYLSIDQFEAYGAAGQIFALEHLKASVSAINAALGKHAGSFVDSIDVRIATIRAGTRDEEAALETGLSRIMGRSLGPMSDNALRNIGIEVQSKQD